MGINNPKLNIKEQSIHNERVETNNMHVITVWMGHYEMFAHACNHTKVEVSKHTICTCSSRSAAIKITVISNDHSS